MNKADIRKQMKKERGQLTFTRILMYSGCITDRLLKEPEYRDASVILSYMSVSSEVNTHFLMEQAWKDGKSVAVPKCYPEGIMDFYKIASFEDVKPGKFGIPEPDPVNPVEYDKERCLLLLPCVAFDEYGNRVGYGGGYYDRFAEKHGEMYRIMLAYDFQKVEHVETGEYDIPADVVLTELSRYEAKKSEEE